MAGLEKEETTSIVNAVQTVFLRFGSTRCLNCGMGLSFLGALGYLDRSNAVAYGAAGLLVVILTLASLHRKSHGDSGSASGSTA